MGKVILVCGKICSGKSYYSKQLKDSVGDATRKVNTGAGIYYKVKAAYGDNGLINSITVN